MEKQQEQEKTVLDRCPVCGSTSGYPSQAGMHGIHNDDDVVDDADFDQSGFWESALKAADVRADDGINWRLFQRNDGSFDLHKLFNAFSSEMEFINNADNKLHITLWLSTIQSIFPIRSRQVATLILAQSLYMAGHRVVHSKIDLKNILSKNDGN